MPSALVIVAHPDDETIWMGGTLLAHPDWSWKIVSLSRKNDADRMPKFNKVCLEYKAKSIMGDLDDEILEPLTTKEVSIKILELLTQNKYDYIFTHGENGEYGHLRHKETHKAVKNLVSKKILRTKKLCFFSYIPSEQTAPAYKEVKLALPNKKANWLFKLNDKQHSKKIDLITKYYGFSKDSFETWSCKAEEAFNYG